MRTKKFLLLMFGLLLSFASWAQPCTTTQTLSDVYYVNPADDKVTNVIVDKVYDGTTGVPTLSLDDFKFIGEDLAAPDISAVVATENKCTITAVMVSKHVVWKSDGITPDRQDVDVTLTFDAASCYRFDTGLTKTIRMGMTVIPSRTLQLTGATVSDKVYDGNKTATVTAVTLSGMLGADVFAFGTDIKAVGEFSAKDAAPYTDVKVTGILGTTTLARDYGWLPAPPAVDPDTLRTGTAEITPKTITVDQIKFKKETWAYDGSVYNPELDTVIYNGVILGDAIPKTASTVTANPVAWPTWTIGSHEVDFDVALTTQNYQLVPNPTLKAKKVTFKVTPVPLQIRVNAGLGEIYGAIPGFDGTDYSQLTYTLPASPIDVDLEGSLELLAETASGYPNAGLYKVKQGTLKLKGADAGNYEIEFVEGNYTITKATGILTVTLAAPADYNGLKHDLTFTPAYTGKYTVTKDSKPFSSTDTIVDAGAYTITIAAADLQADPISKNYDLTYTTTVVTLGKRLITVVPPVGRGKEIGAADPKFTYDIKTLAARDEKKTIIDETTKLAYVKQDSYKDGGLKSPAGDWKFIADSLKITDSNYGWATARIDAADSTEFHIGKRRLVVKPNSGLAEAYGCLPGDTVNLRDGKNYTVWGEGKLDTTKITGFVGGTLLREPGNAVGKYKFTDITRGTSGSGTGFYSDDYDFELDAENKNVLEITKGVVYFNVTASVPYGTDNPLDSATYIIAANFEGFKTGAGATGRGDDFAAADITAGKLLYDGDRNVGEHKFITDGIIHKNYIVKPKAGAVLKITPVDLIVYVKDAEKFYGTPGPALDKLDDFRIDDAVYGWKFDDATKATYKGAATYERKDSVPGTNVGTYLITQGDFKLDTPWDKNYVIVFHNGNMTVKPATLTLKPDAATKVYGDKDPDFIYNAESGLAAWDKLADIVSGTLTREKAVPADGAGRYVGKYEIQKGTLEVKTATPQNYVIPLILLKDSLEITKAPLRLTPPAGISVAYGDVIDSDGELNDYPVTDYPGTVTSGDLKYGETIASAYLHGAFGVDAKQGDNVGDYKFNVGTITAMNYEPVILESPKFAITAAKFDVILAPENKDVTITYGDDLNLEPIAKDAKYTDVKLDGKLGLPTAEYPKYPNVAGSPYTIGIGTVKPVDTNYEATFVTGPKLIVNKAKLTEDDLNITGTEGLVYDGNGHTANVDFADNGKDYTGVTVKILKYVSHNPKGVETMAPVNADTYDMYVVVTVGSASNFVATTPADTIILPFVIEKAPLVVTANDTGKKPGEVDPVLTFTTDPAGVTATGKLVREEGEGEGVYIIEKGTLDFGSNYEVEFNSGKFTIGAGIDPAKKQVTVIVTGDTKVYGESDPEFAYEATVDGVVDAAAVTGTLVREAGEDVGNYSIGRGSLKANDGYQIVSFESATFKITKKGITVTAIDKTKIYGEIDPDLGYSVDPQLVGTDAFDGELNRQNGETPGEYKITKGTLTAGDNYTITFKGATFTITKAEQSINFEALPAKTDKDAPFALEASASSGLAVTFTSSNTDVATVTSNGVVTIKAAGETTITASQAGNVYYNAAVSKEQKLTVTKGTGISSVEGGVKVYPSPALKNSSLSVEVNDGALYGKATIEVYNVAGKLIDATPVKSRITTMTAPAVSGTYIYILKTKEGVSKTMKVLVK